MSQVERTGSHPDAIYLKQVLSIYRGNRFIEALPEIADPAEEIRSMQRLVCVNAEDRALPAHLRRHLLDAMPAAFLQPMEQHIELSERVSSMLRNGYLDRNPESTDFLQRLGLALANLKNPRHEPSARWSRVSGRGMAVIGMSGVGKSRAIEAVLDGYPQVVWHSELTGSIRTTYQIVWIKLSCPTDGSTKTVCRNFFTAVDRLLGTNYHHLHARNGTLESMRDDMYTTAFNHGLGVLVIDEVQNLRHAKGANVAALLKFFLMLRDDLNVPVVAIGTEDAISILGGNFEVARRHTGSPLFERMKHDEAFTLFCESMFLAQYLREPIKPSADLLRLLHYLSQGITDLILKLFVLAQTRALSLGLEKLTAELFQEVYDDCLQLLHPYLDDIRRNIPIDHAAYDDAIGRSALGHLQPLASSMPSIPHVATRRELASVAANRGRGGASPPVKQAAGNQARPKASDVSVCELVQMINGRADGIEPHAVLRAAGLVRELGSEVLAEIPT